MQIFEDRILEPLKLQLPRRRDLLCEAVLREVLRVVLIFVFQRQSGPLSVEDEKFVEVFDEVVRYLKVRDCDVTFRFSCSGSRIKPKTYLTRSLFMFLVKAALRVW